MEFTLLYILLVAVAIAGIFGLGYIIGVYFERKKSEERIQAIYQKPVTNPIRREYKQ